MISPTPSPAPSPIPTPALSHLLTLHGYVAWADHRQADACAAVPTDIYLTRDFGFSFRTLHDTLLHMMSAQEVWLSRFLGQPATRHLSRADFPDLPSLRAHWPTLHQRFRDYLLSGPDLTAPLTWTSFTGASSTTPLGHLLQHVLDHATLHRGQLNSLLKLAGATPPLVMYITYINEAGSR